MASSLPAAAGAHTGGLCAVYDYVIVGGGSAGSVLAGRLSEDPSVRVCLLEAGGSDTTALIHCPAGLAAMARLKGLKGLNWAFETVPQPGLNGRRGYQPRGRVLGGSSSINAMIYARGHPSDYEHWAAAGNPGWAWEDVLPVFKRAEHNERGADAFRGTGGPLNVTEVRSPCPVADDFVRAGVQAGFEENPDFNGERFEGVGRYQVTHRQGERYSAAKAYLTPHRSRPNLEVLTGAQATRIVLDGKRATGVEAVVGGTRRRLEAAREVLVCAGALQSPQLLMVSGIGPGAHLQGLGVPVLHDLPGVGEHLHDHIDVVMVVNAPGLASTFGLSLGGLARVGAGILEWRRARTGMLTTNFGESGGFVRSRPEEPLPDLQLHFVIGKLVDHGRKTVFGHGYSCHVCVLQPASRGRVTLASPDPLAAPLIDPAFLQEQADTDRLVRGFKLMRHILAQPALARHGGRESAASAGAQTDAQIERFVRDHADTIYHPVGSCRMGRGPGDVVDAALRVRGVQNLRVVDASIMPNIVSGNTNAPVVMIAERAVDLIRGPRA